MGIEAAPRADVAVARDELDGHGGAGLSDGGEERCDDCANRDRETVLRYLLYNSKPHVANQTTLALNFT